MGAFMSKFWFMLFPAKEYKIVVVGLDNAGLGSRRTRQTSDITGNIVSRNSCSYCSDRQHRHNTARIGTKDELFRLLPHEDLPNSVVLVFANKQDPCGDN
ncbi:hypothetical protein ACSBR2_031063 [Camellia fascicularis]